MHTSSQRPYLMRAIWEWISDNGMTPHLLVDATRAGVRVPPHTVQDGRVVLNIASRAVAHLQMGNEEIAFSARFGGQTHAIIVPVQAVLAIYARETGQGMALPPDSIEQTDEAAADDNTQAAAQAATSGRKLAAVADPQSAATTAASAAKTDTGKQSATADDDDDTPRPPTGGGRGHLRVVK